VLRCKSTGEVLRCNCISAFAELADELVLFAEDVVDEVLVVLVLFAEEASEFRELDGKAVSVLVTTTTATVLVAADQRGRGADGVDTDKGDLAAEAALEGGRGAQLLEQGADIGGFFLHILRILGERNKYGLIGQYHISNSLILILLKIKILFLEVKADLKPE
jgi:hypothetical protein